MTKSLIKTLMALVMLVVGAASARAQSFSCPYGEQPSCLDYGDKVCSSFGKCVDQNAACFDTGQCDYEGFTCKSNVTALAGKYDDLVNNYNLLLQKSHTLADEYDQLASKTRSLTDENDSLKSNLDDLEACVRRAASIEEAQYCLP